MKLIGNMLSSFPVLSIGCKNKYMRNCIEIKLVTITG